MCGIVGIVAHKSRVVPEILERATESLAHRGPDDSGTIILRDAAGQGEVGLGNRRLAILDLSPLGHQPMHDPETGNWIVYNGEIYNFREIRKDLEALGTRFLGHSDTEVVLKAYARWGMDCLEKFRGMFAFALWDAQQHRLLVARDPMGIKPLYYAQSGPHFLFASEVRTLLGTGLLRNRLDKVGLTNFLTFGSAYDPYTPVEGIYALPAGHALTWEAGKVTEHAYWDLVDGLAPTQNSSSQENEDIAIEHLRSALDQVVQMQLVSDVPVGIFLSGGIDSSALVSILARKGVKPSTFSIVFREADFSEAKHSRAVAAKFGTDHHEITVSQSDVLAAIPDAMRAMDQPTMDGINTYFVSRETRKSGVKVVLSGLGGDEVFGGYATFRTVPRMERFAEFWKRTPRMFRAPLGAAFSAMAPKNDRYRKLASLASENGQVIHPYFLARMLFTPSLRDKLLLQRETAAEEIVAAAQRDCLEKTRSLDPINRVSYLESRWYMLNTLLRDADFMSMSQGLEVRVPLIDHQLAKSVLALPGAWKLNHTPKRLLVEALAGALPDEIVYRPKLGFALPFEHWMRDELRNELESVLQAKRIDQGPLGGVLSGHGAEAVWKDFLDRRVSWSRPWSLYVLQRWCEAYSVSA
ncbi:MAG TPA: asparagine synthase (glutamine-hydrolyzing) [Candidatus Sulfotelmatobacter sp.]|jgi:asparagine synthase (glutamine-hydrolysing)